MECASEAESLSDDVIKRVQIVTNDHFVGGRETFIQSYCEAAKKRGYDFSIVARLVHPSSAQFASWVAETGKDDETINNWIRLSKGKAQKQAPSLIWSQHYNNIIAYALACSYKMPWLVTFHGPLFGKNSSLARVDLVGLVLAVCRGARLSAVSFEIAEQLYSLGVPSGSVEIMPNRIYAGNEGQWIARGVHRHFGDGGRSRVKVSMLTRFAKLEHQRSALTVYSHLRRMLSGRGTPSQFDLYTGRFRPSKDETGKQLPSKTLCKMYWNANYFGKKWIAANPSVALALESVNLISYTDKPLEVAMASDVVMGMGRALLEGAYAGALAVLIGYEAPIDVLDNTNYDQLSFSNFSGRGAKTLSAAELASRLNYRLMHPMDAAETSHLSWRASLNDEAIIQFCNFLEDALMLPPPLPKEPFCQQSLLIRSFNSVEAEILSIPLSSAAEQIASSFNGEERQLLNQLMSRSTCYD